LLTVLGCAESKSNSPGVDVAGDSPPSDTLHSGSYDRPDYFPAQAEAADEFVVLDGLVGSVRVLTDDHGVPHIYGSELLDVIRAQGYMTSRQRLFQMHTLRSVVDGNLASYAGSGSLRGDVYLRVLNLHSIAKKMAEAAKTENPELYAVLEAYAAGVNARIAEIKAGKAKAPLEVDLFKLDVEPWTPEDTMKIVRLQTWDLGFGGYVDDDELLAIGLDLKERYDGTALEGIEQDVTRLEPPNKTPTMPLPGAKPAVTKPLDWNGIWNNPLYKRVGSAAMKRMVQAKKQLEDIPHHVFRSDDFGSNNWAVAGMHTADGKAILANDTHLALRNPAIFHQVHLSTVGAGGDYEVNGVNFAGGPGIVLGHNNYGSWGATVFFSDVTDVYVETVDETGKKVLFNGDWVSVEEREESFSYIRPPDKTCADAVEPGSWINNLKPKFQAEDNIMCRLTVTVTDVPHHGPVVPWTIGTDTEGNPTFMSWKWTGFEPTRDYTAVFELNRAKNVEEFKAALDFFDVGAQNWLWADREGNIAWYPSHQLPVRAHTQAGDTTNPPFLPMPGDGTAEWDGFLDRSLIPQATNPEKGFLVTANSDPLGYSFDNNPLNDGPYIGAIWDAGFRMARASDRLEQVVEAGDVTRELVAAIQDDHRSNLGFRMTSHLLTALDAAASGLDAQAAAHLPENIAPVRALLESWSFEAASGVGAADDSDEARDSEATAIFNAFLVMLVQNTLADEKLDDITDQLKVRLLLRMLETPESMATWDSASNQSRIWDDQDTAEVETKASVLVKSLAEGLLFLSAPLPEGTLVGNGNGFGTPDMNQWRWGHLHTVTLAHPVVSLYSIPPSNDPTYPGGFPRPGDNFTVDACHPGMGDTRFTYTGGPAIRNVYAPGADEPMWGVIPGGQDEFPGSTHYSDEMDNWWQNIRRVVPYAQSDVEAARESIVDLIPPSALK